MNRTASSFSLSFESRKTCRYRNQFLEAISTPTSPHQDSQADFATAFAVPPAGRHLRAPAPRYPNFARRLRRGDQDTAELLIDLLRGAAVYDESAQLQGWALVAMFERISTLDVPFTADVVDDLQHWLLAPKPQHVRARATGRRASSRHKRVAT